MTNLTTPRGPDQFTTNGPWYKPERFDQPQEVRVTNASSKGKYTGTAWNIRAGGEDHKKHPSRGF